MHYTGKLAELLRRPLNQLEEKMMPQMDKAKMGKKLLEHHPIESKVEVEDYGMALKQS